MDNVDNPGNETIADFSKKNVIQDELSTSWSDKFEEDTAVNTEQLKNLISDSHDPKDLEAVFEVPVMVSAVLGKVTIVT